MSTSNTSVVSGSVATSTVTRLPRVSVIVPAFNAAQTIAKTLESLIAQTFAEWEAIVIDDDSADSTFRIADRMSDAEPRIRLVQGAQLGPAVARNAGISRARSEWLLFLNADQTIEPDFLARMMAAADDQSRLVYCGRDDAFALRAALVRRSLVQEIGSFDASATTSQDRDLWDRAARAGASVKVV